MKVPDFQPLFPDDDATRPRGGAVPPENFDLGTTARRRMADPTYLPPCSLTAPSFREQGRH